jgi:hypothetical protein
VSAAAALLGAGLLLLAPSARATVLSDAAAALQPGHFVEISNTGLTGDDLMPDNDGGSILDWSDSGAWDPVLRKFYYVGKEAGCTSTYRNIVYDEATNSWSYGPVPLSSGCGHGYDGNAADPVTGTHYFRPYDSNTIYKRSGSGWTAVTPTMTGSPSIVGGIAKSATGLLYSDVVQDVYYNASQQKVQVSISGGLLGDYHSMAEYNPRHDVLWIGGGNSSRVMYRVNIVGGSPVRVRLNDAPWTFGVGEGNEKTNFTPDPVSGEFVVYRKQTGTFYGYNIMTDTWRTLGQSGDGNMPPLPTGNNTTPVAAPISTHGVIMYIAHRGNNATVYLYKHAASGPADTVAPSRPGQLTAQ